MSLSYRHERQLRLIEADLLQSDPHLAAAMADFGELYTGLNVPAWDDMADELPGAHDRLRRVAAIVVVLAVTIAAISVVLGSSTW
jgi:Protein of unknown function (DUF3040)